MDNSKGTLEESEGPKIDRTTKFCGGAFNKLVFRFRYILIILFFIIGILAAIVATRIGPLTK